MLLSRVFRGLRPLAALLLIVGLGAAAPGGFELRAHVPASGQAVLVVNAYGCHQPEKAKVWGKAEGIVDGERKTVTLTLRKLAAGVYAVERQWPKEGTWVLSLTGKYRGNVSSLLIETERGQVRLAGDEIQMRRLRRNASAADVEGALRQALAHAGR